MKVLAILLNYKTAAMTARALRRLVPEMRALGTAPDERGMIIVVDNDSQDGSEQELKAVVDNEGFDDVAVVVGSGHNGGYGWGNNVGIRWGYAQPDPPAFFYLVNSDAFVDDGAVRALLHHAEAHPRAGLMGSYLRGEDGAPNASAFRFPTVWSEVERSLHFAPVSALLANKRVPMGVPEQSGEVDWICGASLLLRREMLDHIGLFDETFFLYYEETDLCLRAQRAGWQVCFVRESTVTHVGAATTGVHNTKKRTPEYMFASRRHYLLKNHGRAYLWACNAAYAAGGLTFRMRRALQGKADPERPHEYWDFLRYNLTHL